MKKSLESMPGRLIAMLDACHSGEVASQKLLATADDLVRDLVTEDYGVIVMSSSLGTEYSLESPKTKHGFFTFAYTQSIVQQLPQGRQNPTTGRPPGIRSFPLSRP